MTQRYPVSLELIGGPDRNNGIQPCRNNSRNDTGYYTNCQTNPYREGNNVNRNRNSKVEHGSENSGQDKYGN